MATRKGKAKPSPKKPAAKPAKRTTAKTEASAARALRLAAGRVAGQSVARIARTEGLSRTHTSRLLNGQEVMHVITTLVNADMPRIERIWDKVLREIEDALDDGATFAVEKTKDEDGCVTVLPVRVGPDRYARIAAGKLFVAAVCAGRAAPKPVDARELVPKLTLETLHELMQESERRLREAGIEPPTFAQIMEQYRRPAA